MENKKENPIVILFLRNMQMASNFAMSIRLFQKKHSALMGFHEMLFFLTGEGGLLSKGTLERIEGRTCFRSLHVGVDTGLSQSQYSAMEWQKNILKRFSKGASSLPMRVTNDDTPSHFQIPYEGRLVTIPNRKETAMPGNCLDVGTKLGARMARVQQSFNAFVLERTGHNVCPWNASSSAKDDFPPANILFVKRVSTRRWAKGDLSKLKETARRVVNGRGWVRDIVLEDMRWRDQVALLQNASILVAVGGAGAANAMFLPPGSVLALVFAPGWEAARCMHVNTAIASGVHTLVYRPAGVDGQGLGGHPGGPVRPLLPAVAEKRRSMAWRQLDTSPSCRSFSNKKGGHVKMCGQDDFPRKSPVFVHPVDTQRFRALLVRATALIGHFPAESHA